MSKTRDKIMRAALERFARKGYAATSMSDIAAELGITKGAIYRHFDGKRAILDAILNRMEQRDWELAQECNVPEDCLENAGDCYQHTQLSDIRAFSLEMFQYWTEDDFAAHFRRMLALERYHDAEMMALYQNYLGNGPLGYMQDLFCMMAADNPWRVEDAPAMAVEFYGTMVLLMDIADAEADKKAVLGRLEAYIDRFIQRYAKEEG